MKTFKSSDLRRISAEVFRASVEDGVAHIRHSGYKDKIFVLSAVREADMDKIIKGVAAAAGRAEARSLARSVYYPATNPFEGDTNESG